MSVMHGACAAYDYVLDVAASYPGASRILDFGCGAGSVVSIGRSREMNIWGADTYNDGYNAWTADIGHEAKSYISRIENGRLPFPDAYFDFVIANMVFEHVPDPSAPLHEIYRVLRPGGALLALFPTSEVWFEGHLGIYFPHWLRQWPHLQRLYLMSIRSLGFGYFKSEMTARQWAERMQMIMQTMVCYHSAEDVMSWWRDTFKGHPISLAPDYMRYRLALHPRLKKLSPLLRTKHMDAVLSFICHRRAGLVLLAKKRYE